MIAIYDSVIATHYEILGVAPDAPAAVIRESYRARARQNHPDRHGDGADSASTAEFDMAEINEAYRVLKDPGRRAVYDRSLGVDQTAAPSAPPEHDHGSDGWSASPPPTRRRSVLSPDGPARYPWRAMLVLAAVGSTLVLVSAAMTDSPADEVPDGIIRNGSCVAIEPNGDAREIACTGTDDDVIVELLVPLDARCPAPLEPHRDRLGLGIACIDS